MRFPKAANGLNYVFRAEILELIVTVILSVVAGIWSTNTTVTNIVSVCEIVLILGCMLILIKGLQLAAQDEDSFRIAYEITIGLFVAEIILNVLSIFVKGVAGTSSFANTLAMISNILICDGIRRLFARQGDMKNAEFGRITTILLTITACLSALGGVALLLVANASETLGTILSIATLVLMIVSCVLYLVLVKKGTKKLA